MNVPSGKRLIEWIYSLIQEDKLYKFYKTKDWLELKQEVMREHNYECQECLKRGRYTRADCVHHVNEVKKRPDLALSKVYIDENGQEQKQLIPLCKRCHNNEHERFGEWQGTKRFKNEERW